MLLSWCQKEIETSPQNYPSKILRAGLFVFSSKMKRQKSELKNPLKKAVQKRKIMLSCK